MPAQPLIDLATLDLSRELAGREEIRRLCLQRNRFEMIDSVLYRSPEDDLIVGCKVLRTDDWWAPDHIPGRPIFPGVLQLEAAAQLATYHFLSSTPSMAHKFVGFGGIDKARFRGVITPPARLILVAKRARVRETMFNYAAQGFVDGKLVVETEIMGVIV